MELRAKLYLSFLYYGKPLNIEHQRITIFKKKNQTAHRLMGCLCSNHKRKPVGLGLAFGFPLLVLSLLSGALQRQLTSFFARYSRVVNIVGGLLLIGVAVYDLNLNWEMLRSFNT